jgi:SAM-dependent methyltransferase
MIRALLHRHVSAAQRRRLRRWLTRLGFEHRFLRLRRRGYRTLRGTGFEIGAFEHPAPVPRRCRTAYVDVITPAQAKELFPEIDVSGLVPVDHLVDLDADGLKVFPDGSQDFAIACHVIEHVANPGRLIAEMVRVLRPGGRLVIAAPDRDYTFDRARPVTPIATLHHYFVEGRPPVGPQDYRDIIDHVHPELARAPAAEIDAALRQYHRRREHLSVWTAAGFREFLVAAFGWCGVEMIPEYESLSAENRFEYFGVWVRR